ncbi:hypothetical protein BF7_00215 [Pseudomonas phage Bf7]|uniref:Uncharacterized protein n=1 Tax=Pseudomonas phage Bf7 TaxID=1100790 RepID=H2ELX9_9CAUD|nr:tail fiber protein [Pseudomonas phage Bf7]AEX65881.1 hypothetical protein BF7_00215 [Pseudomonas phage Bf7]
MQFPKTYREGFTVYGVRRPRYASDSGKFITAEVNWGEKYVPYAISALDPEPWGKDLFDHCLSLGVTPYTGKSDAEYAAEAKAAAERQALEAELADLMIDVQLQLATPEQLARAKEIRLKLKE